MPQSREQWRAVGRVFNDDHPQAPPFVPSEQAAVHLCGHAAVLLAKGDAVQNVDEPVLVQAQQLARAPVVLLAGLVGDVKARQDDQKVLPLRWRLPRVALAKEVLSEHTAVGRQGPLAVLRRVLDAAQLVLPLLLLDPPPRKTFRVQQLSRLGPRIFRVSNLRVVLHRQTQQRVVRIALEPADQVQLVQALHDDDKVAGVDVVQTRRQHLGVPDEHVVQALANQVLREACHLARVGRVVDHRLHRPLAGDGLVDGQGLAKAAGRRAEVVLLVQLRVHAPGHRQTLGLEQQVQHLLVLGRAHQLAAADGVTFGQVLCVGRKHRGLPRSAQPLPGRPARRDQKALGRAGRHADEQVANLVVRHLLEVLADQVHVPVPLHHRAWLKDAPELLGEVRQVLLQSGCTEVISGGEDHSISTSTAASPVKTFSCNCCSVASSSLVSRLRFMDGPSLEARGLLRSTDIRRVSITCLGGPNSSGAVRSSKNRAAVTLPISAC